MVMVNYGTRKKCDSLKSVKKFSVAGACDISTLLELKMTEKKGYINVCISTEDLW